MMPLFRFAIPGMLLLSAAPIGPVSGRVTLPNAWPLVRPNPNTARAGVLRDGVLTVSLEARESSWRPDGPDQAPMTIEAFSELGKPSLLPGPLMRVPAGTEIRVSVRNSLSVPLTFFLPAAIRGGPDQFTATDSIVVAPGAVGLLTTRASVPGNYIYRATTPSGTSKAWKLAGLLGGGAGGRFGRRDRTAARPRVRDHAGDGLRIHRVRRLDERRHSACAAGAGAPSLYDQWPFVAKYRAHRRHRRRFAPLAGDQRDVRRAPDAPPRLLLPRRSVLRPARARPGPDGRDTVDDAILDDVDVVVARTGRETGSSIVISRCICSRILSRPPQTIRTTGTWWVWCLA